MYYKDIITVHQHFNSTRIYIYRLDLTIQIIDTLKGKFSFAFCFLILLIVCGYLLIIAFDLKPLVFL